MSTEISFRKLRGKFDENKAKKRANIKFKYKQIPKF